MLNRLKQTSRVFLLGHSLSTALIFAVDFVLKFLFRACCSMLGFIEFELAVNAQLVSHEKGGLFKGRLIDNQKNKTISTEIFSASLHVARLDTSTRP